MKVLLVRAVQYQQASQSSRNECALNPSQGSYFEVVTWGWTSGANYRTRKFMTIDQVFGYLNKLNNLGYLSDDAHSDAWNLALPFMENLEGKMGITGLLSEKAKVEAAKKLHREEQSARLLESVKESCNGATMPGRKEINFFDPLSKESAELIFPAVMLDCLR